MDRQLFEETFSCIHASEDTVTEVIKMAKQQDTKNRTHHPVRTGILIGLAAVLLVGAAYAAADTGFIQSVFGAKGQTNIAPHEVLEEAKGSTYTAPGREWADVDAAQAEALIGEYVGTVGASVSVGDWTLTVDDFIIDDHGVGAITYTLANPDGLGDTIRYSENGEYAVNGTIPGLREIGLYGSTQAEAYKAFDTRNIVDKTLTTDTELHAVMYFAPFHRLADDETIHMCVSRVLTMPDPDSGEDAEWEEKTLSFTLDSFIPSVELQSPEGYTVHVSPIGLFFDECFEAIDGTAYCKDLTVQLADGTDYALKSSEPYMENRILGCESFDGQMEAYVFNRIVDAESVVSVTRNGPNGTVLVFTPAA